LRAAGGTETMRENFQDWLELDEGDPGFQLVTNKEFAAVIYIFFISTTYILLSFPLFCSPSLFVL
jgi:hypothetical protein